MHIEKKCVCEREREREERGREKERKREREQGPVDCGRQENAAPIKFCNKRKRKKYEKFKK